MPIRLLKKEEIASAQAKDRTREIEEGLKLSKRVDGLRELMAKEEEALAKFRGDTLSLIMADIAKANSEKEDVMGEVQRLRNEKAEGLQEVEKRETALHYHELDLDTRWKAMEQKEADVAQREQSIEKELAESRDELERARSRMLEADTLHSVAFQAREDAVSVLEKARRAEDDSLKSRRELEAQSLTKHQALQERERALEVKAVLNEGMLRRAEQEHQKTLALEKQLTERENSLVKGLQALEVRQQQLEKVRNDVHDELARAKTHKETAQKLHKKAQEDRESASKTLLDAKNELARVYAVEKETADTLQAKAADLEAREKQLLLKLAENERITAELDEKAIQLADQRKTLDRAIGRFT